MTASARITANLELRNFKHVLSASNRDDHFSVFVDRLTLERGRFISILGESGCGKTTLLTLLGLLRAPSRPGDGETPVFHMTIQTEGSFQTIDILDLWKRRSYQKLEELRRRYLGFALQEGELLLSHTVSQNIAVPLALNGITGKKAESRVRQLLEAFGLSTENRDLGNAKVQRLSGGEKQRVVLARSIAHAPQLVFIDEPTAALNRDLARSALQNLKEIQSGSTIVMITHDELLAKEFSDVIVRMKPDGNSGYVDSIENNASAQVLSGQDAI